MEEKEEFGSFFEWKIKQEIENWQETASYELAKSLGLNKDMKDFTLPPYDVNKAAMPDTNREVRLIHAWRAVENAQTDLEAYRVWYKRKLEELAVRWRKVEVGQVELKSNLVKYNSFVREKQGKVADEISRRLVEKQKQAEKKKAIKKYGNCPLLLLLLLLLFSRLEISLSHHKTARSALEKVVEKRTFYR